MHVFGENDTEKASFIADNVIIFFAIFTTIGLFIKRIVERLDNRVMSLSLLLCSRNHYTKFRENSVITSFDELKYFTNIQVSPIDPGNIGLFYGAFQGCSKLESITLMPNIKTLSNNVFARCISLKHIDIPNTIEIIESTVFDGCTSLETVNFPSKYPQEKFPDGIFRNCSSLTTLIEISATITEIGQAAFWGCTSLAGIKMLGTTPPYLNYGVFNDTTFPIYVPNDAVKAYKSAWSNLQSRIIGY